MGFTGKRGPANPAACLVVRGALAALTAAALLELGTRLVFPLPEIANFDRLWYAGQGETEISSLAHASVWWWSEADEEAIVRRLNLYGFRGPTWKARSPRGVRRIGFFGDSFVEGLGASDDATIPVVFGRGAAAAGRRWEVLNFGAAGFGFQEYLPLISEATEHFELDEVILGVYPNDLYSVPDPGRLPTEPRVLRRRSLWELRLPWAWTRLRSGERLPRLWYDPAGSSPRPLVVESRFAQDPALVQSIERWVEPDLAAMMRAGALNPVVTNLLNRSARTLDRPIAVTPVLMALAEHLEARSVGLTIVYIPSLNQVSDAYLPAQRRLSAPIEEETLTVERFQRQARDLARGCATAGVTFFDSTPGLVEREGRGERLYWPYDSHMRAAGYRAVAEDLLRSRRVHRR
jgi:hypothetical protein